MWNTTKGILGIFPFNHIANQWQVSYHFFWFHLIILCGVHGSTRLTRIQWHVVELQRTGCYSRWDHHVQAISSLSLHITFLPPQPPLPTSMILPTPTTTYHKATKPEMTATVHEHATPLQNHSHVWPHKHWATSPLITCVRGRCKHGRNESSLEIAIVFIGFYFQHVNLLMLSFAYDR